ncbi:sigma factor [Glaciihabitans sp. UYNi722]|uniref:sigma factor n=1 Tax=Glaciihabitans sp. UYNi722 TaxID=3156344 RepID=UPI003394E45E
MNSGIAPEDLLRTLTPQVLGALLRRYGSWQFDLCEDAVQEALLASHEQWARQGQPVDPRAWLITTATRRFIDRIRSEKRRRDRELTHLPSPIRLHSSRPGIPTTVCRS